MIDERGAVLVRDARGGPVLAAPWHADADALVTADEDFFATIEGLRIPILHTMEALGLLANS